MLLKRRIPWPLYYTLSICLLSGLTLFFVPRNSAAQEVTAAMTGKVTDPSGAAIVGATFTATDKLRGTTWSSLTNAEGFYNLPRIPVGTYDVRVEAKGFQSAVQTNVVLQINQTARLDFQMQLGAVTQTVEVTGAPPLLQTDTMQVGYVSNTVTNISLPLATRNFVQLTLLAPGVINPNPSSMNSGMRTSGGGRPYVNGNRKEANDFLLDGVDNNQVSDNLTAYEPNVDAIQEFNMITNNAPAEFGNFEGGVINTTIKSGTNSIHGDAFEFIRNDKLNANNWGRNYLHLAKPGVRWNMFGGTIGGPIKKDKLFYFGDFQGQRFDNPPVGSLITLFTPAERQGDFSAFLNPPTGIKKVQLLNPCASLSGPCQPLPAGAQPQPFPNNQIPISMIDPVAAKLFSSNLYPAPTINSLQFNAVNTSHSATNTDQGDVRIDAKPSEKDSIFGRYSMSNQHNPGFSSFPLFFNTFNDSPFRGAVVDWTRDVSPTLVNDARIGFNRIVLHNGGLDKGGGNIAQNLGIQNGNDRGPGLMSIAFPNGIANGIGNANIGTQQNFVNNEFQYGDTLIITHGRHIMKTGAQFIRQQLNIFYAGNNGRTGFINFDGQFTGLAEADFFLGLPQHIGRGVNTGTWGHRGNVISTYFQDDWRASDHLTLNLGLRWEDHTPWVEVHNRQTNFSPFTGTEELAGQNGNSRALYNSYNADFQPRFGFAWTPGFLGTKTVFRGAYTISSFLEGTGTNLRLPLNPPFNEEFDTNYSAVAFPGSTTDQGLSVLVPKSNPFANALIRLWDPNVRPSKVQQWNFSVEHQLPHDSLFSLGYIGQHGTHLMVPMPYFQKRLPGVDQCPATAAAPCASPYLSGNPALATIQQISGTESRGKQRYDALQASLTKHYSQGLQFQVSYTWSKTMTDSIGYYGDGGQAASNSAYWQNLYDSASEWGRSYFDATHNFVASYVYELPFGAKKRWGSDLNPVANAIFGDWQLSGILTLHTGFPITITGRDKSGTNSRGARADCIGPAGGNHGVGLGATWFNTASFSQPTSGFGTCGDNTVVGPGERGLDLGVDKEFPVTESKRFEFRAEFLNLTNTPIFNAPNRSVVSSQFGEVTSAQGERNIQLGLKFYF